MTLENMAIGILKNFPIYEKMPASISGKHHNQETSKQHLEKTVSIIQHLCDEFNVELADRDMLIAAGWLHDIGLYVITREGKSDDVNWKNYDSGYCRLIYARSSHGSIGAAVLEKYEIPRKKEIQRLISTHMSHWYPNQPQPNCLYEYILCMADYTASLGDKIFCYEK